MEHKPHKSIDPGHGLAPDPESLMHLFSPPFPPVRIDPELSLPHRRVLWSEDSAHRAKNFAQLAAALVYFRPRTLDPICLEVMATNACIVAAAYAELAEDQERGTTVPCADLLTRIVEGLVALFEDSARVIRLRCSIAELRLTSEHRRALVLIASELVLNALKYAFPETGGSIEVSLSVDVSHARLAVEDDGVGLGAAAKPGDGSRILDELAVLLGAPIERAGVSGGGLLASVQIPREPLD
ncbi:sensor histidine kinase [Sphingomonas sp. JC676]|uniref:sensor histidine kinase n=1 Tax=Sphingomonas sp. JC676 TaxID=2768065 RepID=UPI001657827E|nr:sensor histidine kinase [Sphingomonas sp. JC676]MBC9032135.1 sensor histidine kinase [Sphingomonas sp. JC676]